MSIQRRFVLILSIIFVFISILITIGRPLLSKWDIDYIILLSGNALLFIVGLGIFLLQGRALKHANPNVFIRSIMSGMMIKMLIAGVAVVIYAVASGEHFSKSAVICFLILYVVYLVAEVTAIMKLSKSNG